MENSLLSSDRRNYGIDLLRMLSMFMVSVLHVLGQGSVLSASGKIPLNYAFAWFLEISAYCAVNCYALISGYVGVKSRFKYTTSLIFGFRWFSTLFRLR